MGAKHLLYKFIVPCVINIRYIAAVGEWCVFYYLSSSQGSPGDRGPAGSPGADGAPGERGDTGLGGAKGEKGLKVSKIAAWRCIPGAALPVQLVWFGR